MAPFDSAVYPKWENAVANGIPEDVARVTEGDMSSAIPVYGGANTPEIIGVKK